MNVSSILIAADMQDIIFSLFQRITVVNLFLFVKMINQSSSVDDAGRRPIIVMARRHSTGERAIIAYLLKELYDVIRSENKHNDLL